MKYLALSFDGTKTSLYLLVVIILNNLAILANSMRKPIHVTKLRISLTLNVSTCKTAFPFARQFFRLVLQLLNGISGWCRDHFWIRTTGIPAVPRNGHIRLARAKCGLVSAVFCEIARATGWTPEIEGTIERVPTATHSAFSRFILRQSRDASFLDTARSHVILKYLNLSLLRLKCFIV